MLIMVPVLIWLSLMDFYSRILPNEILIFLAALALESRATRAGVLISFGSLFFLIALREIMRVEIGYGDIKLIAVLGLANSSIFQFLTMLELASFLAAISLILGRIQKRSCKRSLPLAPYLSLAFLGCLTPLIASL